MNAWITRLTSIIQVGIYCRLRLLKEFPRFSGGLSLRGNY